MPIIPIKRIGKSLLKSSTKAAKRAKPKAALKRTVSNVADATTVQAREVGPWDWTTTGATRQQAAEIKDVLELKGLNLTSDDTELPIALQNVANRVLEAKGITGGVASIPASQRREFLASIIDDPNIVTEVQNDILRANYAPRDPEEAIANLQAAGADRLAGRKTTPRTIQGPVPPRLADKTFGQDAQSYEEAVMLGTTKFTEGGEAKMIRNYGSPTAPHGRVTKVDVRKMSGRGTEGRITWEKLLTLDKNAKGFYGVKLKGKEHAHHWNPIGVMKRVVEGLDPKVRNQLIAEAQDEFGLYSGNTMFNLRQLPTEIHDLVHKALDARGYDPKKLQSFVDADYATRKKFLKQFAKDLSEIDEKLKSKMYKLRLDGHFYTVLDDKIFNEISDQW